MYLTLDNFEQTLQSSMQKPLFCFFYKEGEEACQEALKAVNTAISDNNEFVTLALCDVAIREVMYLAAQAGVSDLPALVVLDQGMPVASLMGSEQVISNLQELLTQFMPNEAELLMREALTLEADNELNKAVQKASQAYELDKSNITFKLIYVRILIALKNTVKARELLDAAGREEKSMPDYQQLLSALELAEKSQNSPELLELERKYKEDASDENAVAYAIALADAGKKEEALELLFAKLKTDLNKEEVKKTFLDILSTMDGDKAQSVYRRKLYTIMY